MLFTSMHAAAVVEQGKPTSIVIFIESIVPYILTLFLIVALAVTVATVPTAVGVETEWMATEREFLMVATVATGT